MSFVEQVTQTIESHLVIILKSATKIGIQFILIFGLWILGRILLSQLKKKWQFEAQGADVRAIERQKRVNTLIELAQSALKFVLSLFLLIGVMSELGVDMKAILASAGIIGIALGFGAQSLVKDIISGFFILFENQIRVGDTAIVNGKTGIVEGLHFRTIELRDVEGTVHVFPNGSISTLANKSRDWSAYVMDIGIAYKNDINEAISIMKEVGFELKNDPDLGYMILADLEVFGVDAFADSSVTIRARLKTIPSHELQVGREYRKRLKYKFDEKKIDIPFPQRSITLLKEV